MIKQQQLLWNGVALRHDRMPITAMMSQAPQSANDHSEQRESTISEERELWTRRSNGRRVACYVNFERLLEKQYRTLSSCIRETTEGSELQSFGDDTTLAAAKTKAKAACLSRNCQSTMELHVVTELRRTIFRVIRMRRLYLFATQQSNICHIKW